MDIFKSSISFVFSIIGSLGLFLYGMKLMSDGLQKVAGDKMQRVMGFVTSNRFYGILTGVIITSFVQSSSATTIMVVSFANAGFLTLVQSISVVMGANIGTTVTGWIVAFLGFKFNIAYIALPTIGIGFIFTFLKKTSAKSWGEAILGFGILFLGLNFLKDSVPDLSANPDTLQFLHGLAGYGYFSVVLFVFIGLLMTVLVQSSSAFLAITLTLAFSGWIDFPIAAALAIGSNVGTTITAIIASLSGNIDAKRVAFFHFLFNLVGAILALIFFYPLVNFVNLIVPGDVFLTSDKALLTTNIAMFHTIFNVFNTIIFLPFVKYVAKFINKVLPEKNVEYKNYKFKFISSPFQDIPEINIMNGKSEIIHMSMVTNKMFMRFYRAFFDSEKIDNEKELEKQMEAEDLTDEMQEQITKYLIDCSDDSLSQKSRININAMVRITDELESIADSCLTLMHICKKKNELEIVFDDVGNESLTQFCEMVNDFLKFIFERLKGSITSEQLDMAYELENSINSKCSKIKEETRERLQTGGDVKNELMMLDFIKHLEHIGDFSLNIAQELKKIT